MMIQAKEANIKGRVFPIAPGLDFLLFNLYGTVFLGSSLRGTLQ